MLADWPNSGDALPPEFLSNSAVCMRLVREAGASPALAARLPAALYAQARHQHMPVQQQPSRTGPDGQPYWEVRHHQLGGFVPSTQNPFPVDFPDACLLQLQSDYGTEMIICDLGEADFWIAPDALARRDFTEAFGDTRGG